MTLGARLLGLVLILSPVAPARAAALLYPNHLPTATLQSQLQAVYTKWKADLVTSAGTGCAGCMRVQRPNDKGLEINSTVSEGMGYGLVIAAYMGDQALFNGLWKYTANWLDGNGLMNWYINAAGTGLGSNPSGSGSAPDADEDVIWGLILAHYKWGDAGTYNYQALANTMLNNFLTYEVQGTTVKDGDGWGGTGGPFNSSYFDPSEYKVFAQFSGNNAWNSVADTSYTDINLAINAANGDLANGLVPAWHDTTGTPVLPFTPSGTERPNWYAYYQYDACRTPFRLAKDYIFFGDSRAKAYLDKVNSYFSPIGAANIVDGYTMAGVAAPEMPTLTVSQYAYSQSAPFIGPAGVAAMAGTNQQFVNDAWDQMYSVASGGCMVGGQYYAESWAVLCMLMMSGQFNDPMPTPTPSPTPDLCQSHIRVNAAGPAYTDGAGNVWAADQAYASGGWGYLSTAAGAVGTSGGPITGTSDPALYLDERYGVNQGDTVSYRFTVPNGPATVTLYWAETYFNSAGQRSVAVSINGSTVEAGLDIYAAAGGKNIALVRSYPVSVTGGLITINFTGLKANATIHALQVTAGNLCTPTVTPSATPNYTRTPSPTVSPSPSASPTFSPSPSISATFTAFPTPDACSAVRRIDCASASAFTDALGQVWAADQAYSAGSYGYVSWAAGTAASSAGPISGSGDGALYMTERYGDPVGYRFSLPNGTYQVRLRFAETYHSAAGQRVMSWSAQGVPVITNLDVFTASGGKNVAYDVSFTTVVSAGLLDLLGTASVDNATVMGIEVIGGSGCTPTRTLTFTPGGPSPTPSATATATPSRSPTPTASPSPTVTPSVSPSVSATPSPTASGSPSASPTATPTLSASPPASATATATASLTLTGVPTPSPSATALAASPSMTPAVSPSLTTSATASPWTSPSVTLTAMRTGSASPTPLNAPSLTPSRTVSPVPSFSATAGLSASVTLTHTPPASLSPSPQTTATLTASPAAPDSTPTPSLTPSLSLSASPSATPTPSPWTSGSSTPTVTATVTMTVTVTSSGTRTGVATSSPTPSATPSVSPAPSATPGATPVVTATPSPQAGPSSGAGPAQITDAAVLPCPWGGVGQPTVALFLQGPADQVRWKLYSVALVCVRQGDLGPAPQGWSHASLLLNGSGLAKGLYYLNLTSEGGGRTNVCHKKVRMLILN